MLNTIVWLWCFGSFCLGGAVVILFSRGRRNIPSAYYQVAVNGKLRPWFMATRARASDRAKEVAKILPGVVIEIWGFERVGYAKDSVSPDGSGLDVRADKIGRPAVRGLPTCRRWSDALSLAGQ
jgi:hypothetical protein